MKKLRESLAPAVQKVKHGTAWKGVKVWGRYARGDWLTKPGKALLIVSLGAALMFLNLVTAAPGQTLNGYGFVGFMLVTGFWVSMWINFEPSGCPGPRHVYSSPTKEVKIAMCHGCEGWAVIVRGEDKGKGNGKPALLEKLGKLAETHSRNVPEVAEELRQAAAKIDAAPDLTAHFDDQFNVDTGSPLGDMPPQVAALLGGFGAIPIARLPIGEDSVPVNADEYRKFQEWQKEHGPGEQAAPPPPDGILPTLSPEAQADAEAIKAAWGVPPKAPAEAKKQE